MPCLLGPGTQIWILISRNLYIYPSNLSLILHTYNMSDTCIPHMDSHKDLGIILSEDLSWGKHYKSITARAYKVLGLTRRIFLPSHSTSTMVKLYVSLVDLNYFTVPKYGIHI